MTETNDPTAIDVIISNVISVWGDGGNSPRYYWRDQNQMLRATLALLRYLPRGNKSYSISELYSVARRARLKQSVLLHAVFWLSSGGMGHPCFEDEHFQIVDGIEKVVSWREVEADPKISYVRFLPTDILKLVLVEWDSGGPSA